MVWYERCTLLIMHVSMYLMCIGRLLRVITMLEPMCTGLDVASHFLKKVSYYDFGNSINGMFPTGN